MSQTDTCIKYFVSLLTQLSALLVKRGCIVCVHLSINNLKGVVASIVNTIQMDRRSNLLSILATRVIPQWRINFWRFRVNRKSHLRLASKSIATPLYIRTDVSAEKSHDLDDLVNSGKLI